MARTAVCSDSLIPDTNRPSTMPSPYTHAQRPVSEALLGWLREVLSDEQVAEATGLALGAVAELRVEGKR
ncbi:MULTISPECIES: hypothetical protein [unclassified Halomonas]|uniref:hypothetical protein n=1 Tax=unclassified Halomonas TaxID=2609666 RepID=UPI000486046A|nr:MULTISPECIES: hypothetical protein [unclassified Halomonas]PKH58593.1 hypothetical protein CXF94_21620 [Halomonas sp. Choline-3u-9]QGQ69479.1 hypothetical protein FDY98_03970 [Halomonas sp. PA16-9]